jgi:glycerol kinase
MIKSTYGTGCFVLVSTGGEAARSRNRLLTTVCYRLGGEVTYALEGSIFIAGAAVQWLRDGLGLVHSAAETEALASSLADNRGVYLVAAFTGLGAAYLAGVQTGVFDSLDDVTANWQKERSFEPAMDASERERLVAGRSKAVSRVRT